MILKHFRLLRFRELAVFSSYQTLVWRRFFSDAFSKFFATYFISIFEDKIQIVC